MEKIEEGDLCDTMPPSIIHSELRELAPLRFPFWRYYALFSGEGHSFLLDSARESSRQGRFSFLGGRPFLAFRAKCLHGRAPLGNAEITVTQWVDDQGHWLKRPQTEKQIGDPFDVLRKLMAAWRPHRVGSAPHPSPLPKGEGIVAIPFLGGAVGYWGYEMGYCIEALPDRGEDDLALPDACLMFPSVVLAHDHAEGRTFLVVFGFGPDEEAARHQAVHRQSEILDTLETVPLPRLAAAGTAAQELSYIMAAVPAAAKRDETTIKAFFNEASYCRAVEEVQSHIAAGDVYQVCLTHRLEAPLKGGTAWDLYGVLRQINPAPFAAYLHFPEVQIVSSSPELFLRLSAEGIAESRPMKGTRPRGTTPEEDARLRGELESSEKDRAENAMIVDLVRNDFGRVSAYGSVRVAEFAAIEEYATVFQSVSTVMGRLAKGDSPIYPAETMEQTSSRMCDGLDLLRACFPGGSMTGAPKIEAMKIIDGLEPVKRGIYSGAIGYHAFTGAMQLAMTIRTIVVKDSRCCFHVGGGIVADSQPAAEYQETLDKARALIRALEISRCKQCRV
jgi:para-aminobenzoate synthetase component I